MILDNAPEYTTAYVICAEVADRTTTTTDSCGWPPTIHVVRTAATRPDPPMRVIGVVEDDSIRHNIRLLAILAQREARNTRPRERAPPVWALKAARRRRPANVMLAQRAHRARHRGPSAAPRFSGEDAIA